MFKKKVAAPRLNPLHKTSRLRQVLQQETYVLGVTDVNEHV